MKAKFSKRLVAYVIDIIILGLVILCVGLIVPKSNNLKVLNIELDTLNEQFLNEQVSIGEYTNHYSQIMHEIDKENIIYTIVNIIFILIYFVVIPYYFNGQTLGKKIIKIKVVNKKEKISLNDLIIRNMIINGLGYLLLTLLLIYLLPSLSYFITIIFLSFIQLILIIITVVGLTKNNDKLILHDRFTNTEVINV